MNETENPAALVCEDVWKVFPSPDGPVRALCGVSLEILPGCLALVRGASGSGKSTLLALLGALDRPTRGRVRTLGVATDTLTMEQAGRLRRRTIGFVMPDLALVSHLTGAENVALALMFDGRPGREVHASVMRLLDDVEVRHRANHLPAQMSVGERLRVAIARALAQGPRVLLADEPTANLDAANVRRVLALLAAQRERGVTVVVASHDERVELHADLVITLSGGEIVPANNIAEKRRDD